jgi:hypothetical protein
MCEEGSASVSESVTATVSVKLFCQSVGRDGSPGGCLDSFSFSMATATVPERRIGVEDRGGGGGGVPFQEAP